MASTKNVLLCFILWLCLGTANGEFCPTKKHGNSLGAVISYDNPLTYKEGSVSAATYVKDNALVVRIQPRGTFSLFTEDILFCPGAADKFSTKHNPLVLVYETQAHRVVDGLGCHELKFVDEIKNQKELE
jgi:hypothetical protein